MLPIFGPLTKNCANLVAKKLVCIINQNLSIANITIKSGNGKFFYHFFSIRAFSTAKADHLLEICRAISHNWPYHSLPKARMRGSFRN